MSKRTSLTCITIAGASLLWGLHQGNAQYVPPPQLVPSVDYGKPNYANSPILRKFVDPLPGLGAGGIPVAVADVTTFTIANGYSNNAAYYEIALVDYTQQMHSDLPATKLRGYVQIYPPGSVDPAAPPAGAVALTYPGGGAITHNGAQVYGYTQPGYLGPVIVADRGTPTRVKFYNLLPAGASGDLFIPTDTTLMGAGVGPDGVTMFAQNRATLHLHGGDNPWISDGTAHQWITPAGEAANVIKKGASQQNVPDMTPMPVEGDGTATFYWPNGLSGRLMFYHDHAFGITRLNVYAGEAAGYLLVDPSERAINALVDDRELPLVIQDKTFVNIDNPLPAGYTGDPSYNASFNTTVVDPLWDTVKWGGNGSLWWPHVYMPNQNPNDLSGANAMGRWDYGGWFWPVFPSFAPPEVSHVPEAFMDTPVINGKAYPYLEVQPAAYRFRILNACNDRFVNLQLYVASPIISGITLTAPGAGYIAPPIVTITPAAGDTTGKGATAEAVIDTTVSSLTFGQVIGINLLTVGSGYTAAPSVTITPAVCDTTGGGATATATLHSDLTEVGMLPAIKSSGIAWPTPWTAFDTPGMIPDVLDGRVGGVPDPCLSGPKMIQIGTEGGILPAPVVLANVPVGYVQNKRDIVVGNISAKTLLLGPAERADVIIDFSQYATAGATLILYNDSPAPVPASDPRLDSYTANLDYTGQGGAPSTQAGFGPNTRTMMQIRVLPGPASPVNQTNLAAAVTSAFAATQPLPIVPLGTTPGVNVARISDTAMTFNNKTIPLQPKAIQELFDYQGRMNSTLGTEVPFTTALIQTTIPFGFADPATEVFADNAIQIWKITHNGVDTHAIHFHLFDVQVINRVGWDGAIRLPDPNEAGWKDTVKMNPLEDCIVALHAKVPSVPFDMPNSVRLLAPEAALGATLIPGSANMVQVPGQTAPVPTLFFGVDPNNNPVTIVNQLANFGDEYTWHCHLLGHEENDMMRPTAVARAPLAPVMLTETVSKGKAVLTWADNSANETAFLVQKQIGTGAWNTIATLGANTTNYTDGTWNGKQLAKYRVVARNTVGSGVAGFPSASASTASAAVASPTVPLGVTSITSVTQLVALGSPVVVNWTYSAADQTGFTVQRSTSSTFPANSTVTVGTVAVNVRTISDTGVVVGLKQNKTYYYRVIATNDNGSGTASSTRSLLVHP